MSALFSSVTLRQLQLSNRIMVAPMCQYSAEDGAANSWHLVHLGSLAMSGAAMLCIEATAVESVGRITPGDVGLWDDRTEAAWVPIVAAMRRCSTTALAMQLAHAGRKGSCHVPWDGGGPITLAMGGWTTSAPSALPQRIGDTPPLELSSAGLDRIRQAFAQAARRAARLELDAIELHAAHGYLLHEFLSPLSNQRVDEYGGSLENRLRFPLEIFDTVRQIFPAHKPIGVKVSATDWVEDGWDLTQTIAFAVELRKRGVDWIDVSSAGISPLQKVPTTAGYQVPFAQAVKQATGVNTIAVGLITDARQANAIIAAGQADLVALARGMLYDPRWAWHAAAELGDHIDAPPQYWRAPPHEHATLFNVGGDGPR
jgi:2,4-dienoyl-CoA reductase-like NADH-dependent reductase (Old Yellow Enzyme family)